MPLMSLGRAYRIPGFMGRRRGGRMIGSILPPKAQQWSRVHTLNLPPLSMHPAWRIVSRADESRMQGYALAGLAWAIYGIAAESPRPGWLAVEDGIIVRPLSDADLCEQLMLTPMDWSRCVALLGPGGGCGILAVAEMSIEVEDGDEPLYRAAAERLRQLDLPLFSGAQRNGAAPLCANDTNMQIARNNDAMRCEAAPHTAAASAEVRSEADRAGCATPNGTEVRAAGAGDSAAAMRSERESAAAGRRGAVSAGDSATAGGPGECEGVQKRLLGTGWVNSARRESAAEEDENPERRLLLLIQREQQAEALGAWLAILEARLKPGEANKGDRSQWTRAFVRIWNGGAREPTRNQMAAFRGEWVRRALDRASEIAADDGVRSRAAVMADWMKRQRLVDGARVTPRRGDAATQR